MMNENFQKSCKNLQKKMEQINGHYSKKITQRKNNKNKFYENWIIIFDNNKRNKYNNIKNYVCDKNAHGSCW